MSKYLVRSVFLKSPFQYIALLLCCLFPATIFAQNWSKVHKADDAKWAKATGLDIFTVHKLWRDSLRDPDEKDDPSRIANLDLDGLAVRHDVLLATFTGERNCLTITVFRRLSETKFSKEWSVTQTPDGAGFCDNQYGTAATDASDGVVFVRVPKSVTDGAITYTVYAYEWNGITYRFAGQKDEQRD